MDWKPPKLFIEFDIPQSVDGNFKAKCKHCTAIISVSTKAYSNLLGHLLVSLFSVCQKKVKHNRVKYVTLVMLVFYNKPVVIHACGQ